MDRIVFKPLEVRGGGNIISPSKALGDFQRYQSTLELSSTTIDNQPVNVFTEEYLPGSYFIGDYQDWLPLDTTEFTVNAVLKTNAGSVISGASVTCTVNNETVLTDTTNSSGEVSFTITAEDYYIYTCRLEYAGTSSVAGCISNVVVKIGEIDYVELIGEDRYTSVDEDKWLLATVTGHDAEGGQINIPYTNVFFWESIGYYPLLHRISVPCESSGTNYCYSIDLDTLDLDLSQYDWTVEFDYINTVNGGRLCIGDSNSWSSGSGAGDNYIYCGTSTAGNGGYGTKRTGTTDNSSAGAVTAGDTLHYKIVKTGTTISYYLNNVLRGTKTATWITDTHTWSMYLQLWNNGETTIRNLSLDLSPRIRVSPSIVENEDTETLTVTLVDPVDGSRVVGETVSIYAEGNFPGPTLTINASPTTVNLGESVTISGNFNPHKEVSQLNNWVIQIYEGTTQLTTTRTDTNGDYSVSITPSVVGTHVYHAYRASSTQFDEVTSGNVSVVVNPAVVVPDSISVTADKSVLSYSDSDECSLTATVLDSSDNPLSGQTVTMKAYQGSSLLETLTVIDNNDGTYTATYDSGGVGDISIVAECSNLQDTYSIEDVYWYSADGKKLNGTYATGTDGNYSYVTAMTNDVSFPAVPSTDFELSMKAYRPTSTSDRNLLFEVGDSRSDTLLVGWDSGASSTAKNIRIYRRSGNSNTSVENNTSPSYNNGEWLDFKIRYENGTVTLTVNNDSINASRSSVSRIAVYILSKSRISELKIRTL